MHEDHRRNVIVTVSFLVWCGLLSFPLMVLERGEVTNQVFFFQVLGLLQFSTIAVLICWSRISHLMRSYNRFQLGMLAIFYLSLGLQLHGDSTLVASGIAYTVALTLSIVLLSLVWTMGPAETESCFGAAALVFVAFAFVAIGAFGWPVDRHVGGIHPNFFGAVMLSAFIFSQFHPSAAMVVVRVICFVLAAAVSTRFAIIGCLIAAVVFEATLKPFSAKLAILAGLAGALVVMFPEQVINILALNDPDRDLSSGFTGREDNWQEAFEAIANNPFGVGFKRPLLEEAGHNGYLKAILEFGIVGGALIIFAVISIIAGAVLEAVLRSDIDQRRRRFASARAGGLVALAFATFFQPQMFNVGDVHGISFILLLYSPLSTLGSRLAPARRLPLHRADKMYDAYSSGHR